MAALSGLGRYLPMMTTWACFCGAMSRRQLVRFHFGFSSRPHMPTSHSDAEPGLMPGWPVHRLQNETRR